MNPNLRALARFNDSLSFLYIEHAIIEREDHSVAAFTAQGRISIPAANLSSLLLGPGTRITHAAIAVLAQCGCVVVWVGEDGLRFYAAVQNKTRSSAGLERQCKAWSDDRQREAVVRQLHAMRFSEAIPQGLSLQQIRGREGARVRDAYRSASQRFGVPWSGRSYERKAWPSTDPVNRALSAANAALYAVCLAATHAQGYSPALGFIHTGKQLSFVYDLADLFKMDLTVPAAFEAAAQSAADIETRTRVRFRELAYEFHLRERIIAAMGQLFGDSGEASPLDADDGAHPGVLWDPSGNVEGGIQHGGDGR